MSYPQGSYPTKLGHPMQQGYNYPPNPAYPQPQQNYGYPQQQQQQQQQPQQHPVYAPQSVPANYPAAPPPAYTPYMQPSQTTVTHTYPGHNVYQTQQTPLGYQQVVQGGSFDPGARFGAGARPNIPPPPPGHMPNSAQMASSHGQNVYLTQRKEDWVQGAPGGGYVFW